VLCVGAWYVTNNTGFTIGMLVAFQMFSSRLSQPMLRIANLWQEFQQAAIAVKRLGDVMNAPAEPYSIVPARQRTALGKIQVENLAFRYGEDRPYLYRNLSLTVEPGETVAVIGPSGVGKSTFVKLLLGFYQPTEGSIRIDGSDVRHLSANELRSYFGVVPQETALFSGTVYDNLILANPLATFEDIVMGCKAAGIHEVIEALPKGYQTPLGEHGAGLSGGQKQRIAIARALLKRASILLLDEATSNLDDESARALGATINQLRGRITIVIIAHDLPFELDSVTKLFLTRE
jgi:subfamily B ATP-binding cassette protein HlyB/CyaB